MERTCNYPIEIKFKILENKKRNTMKKYSIPKGIEKEAAEYIQGVLAELIHSF